MIFSEPERLSKLEINKKLFELEVLEAQRITKEGLYETIKFQYSLFVNGLRKISFCSKSLEDFSIEDLLKKYNLI